MLLFPTNDGQVCIAVEWPHREFHRVREDIERNVIESLSLVPGLAERVQAGRRGARFAGSADLPNFFRKPFGPGWALVGDAGYHKDPVTGTGIGDAFRDAELLGGAVDAGLSGRAPLEQALAGYEEQRNAAAFPMYDFTCRLAAFPAPDPALFDLFGIQRQAPAPA